MIQINIHSFKFGCHFLFRIKHQSVYKGVSKSHKMTEFDAAKNLPEILLFLI